MAAEKVIVTKDYLENIADAIREKTKKGQDGDLLLTDMPDEIRSISGGGEDLLKGLIENTITTLVVPDDVERLYWEVTLRISDCYRVVWNDKVKLSEIGSNDAFPYAKLFYMPRYAGEQPETVSSLTSIHDDDFTKANYFCICCECSESEWPYKNSRGNNVYPSDVQSAHGIMCFDCKRDNGGAVINAEYYKRLNSKSITPHKTIVAYFGDDKVTDLVIDGAILDEVSCGIGDYAFYCLENLETVTIRNIVYLGDNCFNGCKKLKTVNFECTPNAYIATGNFSISNNCFNGAGQGLGRGITVNVPWKKGDLNENGSSNWTKSVVGGTINYEVRY